jgi:hypothetical protein
MESHMLTFDTADPKEVRRFRIAQFNGRVVSVRSRGSMITGHVRSVLESKAGIPVKWTITIAEANPGSKPPCYGLRPVLAPPRTSIDPTASRYADDLPP